MHTLDLEFLHDCWDPQSGPDAGVVGTLLTEPSPQFYKNVSLHPLYVIL